MLPKMIKDYADLITNIMDKYGFEFEQARSVISDICADENLTISELCKSEYDEDEEYSVWCDGNHSCEHCTCIGKETDTLVDSDEEDDEDDDLESAITLNKTVDYRNRVRIPADVTRMINYGECWTDAYVFSDLDNTFKRIYFDYPTDAEIEESNLDVESLSCLTNHSQKDAGMSINVNGIAEENQPVVITACKEDEYITIVRVI